MKFICIIIFFFLSLIINDYELITTVNVSGTIFKTDLLENVYVVNNHNIIKYNTKGIIQFSYSNNYLGNVSYIDVSDPLRILVFYKDFNQVIFLDNTLSVIGSPIILDDIGLDRAELACSSNTGGFWLFNSLTNQLLLIDKNLHIKLQSISISSMLSKNDKAEFLIEKNDYIYLNFPEKGIMIFDKFGTYYKTVPIQKCSSFQIFGNRIIYYKNNKLFSYDIEKLDEKILDIPENNDIRNVRIEQDKLYIFKEKGFIIYQQKEK
jgi:hypothetical protein